MTSMNTVCTDLHRGTRRAAGGGNTSGAAPRKNELQPPKYCPPDLLAFVRCKTLTESVAALGLDRAQINRLRKGYWPRDPRRTLAAWDGWRKASHSCVTNWLLRRVRSSGVVCWGSRCYGAAALAWREGQLVACARMEDGSLAAQSLDAPVERLVLELLS